MKIFVGNLSFSATENDVKKLFEAYGTVSLVSLKKKSGKNSRGFGFVTMTDDLQAAFAIESLLEKEFMGRALDVSPERPKPAKPKKDYKEIKRLRLETKKEAPVVFDAPTIPEKENKIKTFKDYKNNDDLKVHVETSRVRKEAKKFAESAGAQAWEKRKGRGTAKPWKKKPGGVSKTFKYTR